MKPGNYKFALLIISLPGWGASITLQPPSQTVVAGQTLSLGVLASGVTSLYATQFDLAFNPSVLAALSITEGPFLPTGGATTFIPGIIDNMTGTIVFTAETLNGLDPGVNGSGTIANVSFRALSEGTSTVAVSNIQLLDANLASIDTTNLGASVTVNAAPGGTVPEPTTILMSVSGLLAISLLRQRKSA